MNNSPSPSERPAPQTPPSGAAPLPPIEPTPGAPAPPPADGTMGGLIPYKNSCALIAYYLGVFSLACGPLLGVPAFILGILGLKYYKANPAAKGVAHAWVGIIMGGLWIAATLVLILFMLFTSTRMAG